MVISIITSARVGAFAGRLTFVRSGWKLPVHTLLKMKIAPIPFLALAYSWRKYGGCCNDVCGL